jgi:hypothetical protein
VSTLSSFPVIRTIVREGRQLLPDLRAARRARSGPAERSTGPSAS